LHEGKYYDAGSTIIKIILDVLENPGIPDNNGSAAVLISVGIAEGLGEAVVLDCFKDAKVEVPSVLGGALACMTGVGTIAGLESIFHGLEGLVPLFKDCYNEKSEIWNIIKTLKNFKDAQALARSFGHNVLVNKVDLAVLSADVAFAIRGKEWKRVGEDVGKLVGKVALSSNLNSSLQNVLAAAPTEVIV